MGTSRLSWQDELAIIDRTMKAISDVTDPERLVEVYWTGIGELVPFNDYVALSRRHVEPPHYLITRSSRFTEHFNPWTQRDRLPKLTGGVLGEIAYANKPVIIEDLPARVTPEDPAWRFLEGFQTMVAMPQYDGGEGLNVTVMLAPAGRDVDFSRIPMMHWQAGLFGRGTQSLVLRNQLSAALAALDRELQTVGEIQRSLLPAKLPEIPGFELAAHYATSARAGGDYYDFFPLDGGRWGLFIADVSGHGTPAAVFMAITHAIAHAQPGTHVPPAALLDYLNHTLTDSYTRPGTFVTAYYAVLDPANRRLMYSTAGHNPPLLARGAAVISLDRNGGLPLGVAIGEVYGQATVSFERGDMLLLYTDGITEAMAPAQRAGERELFGIERLERVLLESRGGSADACIRRICDEVAAFTGNGPPVDDQTLIAIRCG